MGSATVAEHSNKKDDSSDEEEISIDYEPEVIVTQLKEFEKFEKSKNCAKICRYHIRGTIP